MEDDVLPNDEEPSSFDVGISSFLKNTELSTFNTVLQPVLSTSTEVYGGGLLKT